MMKTMMKKGILVAGLAVGVLFGGSIGASAHELININDYNDYFKYVEALDNQYEIDNSNLSSMEEAVALDEQYWADQEEAKEHFLASEFKGFKTFNEYKEYRDGTYERDLRMAADYMRMFDQDIYPEINADYEKDMAEAEAYFAPITR